MRIQVKEMIRAGLKRGFGYTEVGNQTSRHRAHGARLKAEVQKKSLLPCAVSLVPCAFFQFQWLKGTEILCKEFIVTTR